MYGRVFQDGCIVCPSTDSTFDLRTGEIKEWYPKNPVLRALTPALRKLFTYRVKTDEENIYISFSGADGAGSAEIIFSGKAQPGVTASDVNVEEVSFFIFFFLLFDTIAASHTHMFSPLFHTTHRCSSH